MSRRLCFALLLLIALRVNWISASPLQIDLQTAPASTSTKLIAKLGVVVFPPYTTVDSDNDCVGPYINAAEKLFAGSNIRLNVICAPAARIYRMLEKNEIDFTINVKSTGGLSGRVDFYPIPFSSLELALYKYRQAKEKTVSGIRAFDYNGYRQKLVSEGFSFIDVPTAQDAIELFVRGRSRYLISYKAPYEHYISTNSIALYPAVSKTELERIPTFFAISNISPVRRRISNWLDQIVYEHSLPSLLEVAKAL